MKHKSVTSVAQQARHHTHQPTPPHFSANLEESHREGPAAKLASSTNRQQASHFTFPREGRKNKRPSNVIAASRIRTARSQRPAFHLSYKYLPNLQLKFKTRIWLQYNGQQRFFPGE